MIHTRIYAVILGLFLCCLTVSAEKPQRAKGDRKAGVSTLPLGMAKDKKGKKVGVSTLPLNKDGLASVDLQNMDKAKKGKKAGTNGKTAKKPKKKSKKWILLKDKKNTKAKKKKYNR